MERSGKNRKLSVCNDYSFRFSKGKKDQQKLLKVFFLLYVFICCILFAVMGNCLFAYGRKLGELCRRDADCESGLICDVSAVSGASVCRAPMAVAKQYAEDCLTSSDCDITRYVEMRIAHFNDSLHLSRERVESASNLS